MLVYVVSLCESVCAMCVCVYPCRCVHLQRSEEGAGSSRVAVMDGGGLLHEGSGKSSLEEQ